jgi:signal transduction histidine kinase
VSLGTWSRSARWLVALAPIAIVAIIEILSDSVLDDALPYPLDTVLVVAVVVVLGLVLAALAFRRIDALTGALRARNAELEARGASARALNRVSVAIAAESDLGHVLQAVVTYARELLAADVAVLLLERPDGRLELRAADGLPTADGAPTADRRRATAGSPTTADGLPTTADGRPIVAPPPDEPRAADADAMLAFVDADRATARLAAPLQRGGSTLGILAVGSAVVRGFDADDVETLSSLASQATIALEHARLEARLRELAVVEERERIAHELHDGIAQVLGYVNTKSLAVGGFLDAGRTDEARVQLDELASAARAVYVDVRESIIGLRGPIEPGQGLGMAIAAHARRVADASRFGLELSIDTAAESLRLDPEAETNLYRIVQEALTNVRKHASARRVRLDAAIVRGVLTISVADDGRGLPAGGVAGDKPGYGLRAMRERAASIGATIQVMNGVDGGALVRVTMPLGGHERPIESPVASPEPADSADPADPADPGPASADPGMASAEPTAVR